MPEPMPEELRSEIQRMRRDPSELFVLRRGHCKWCNKKNAIDLGHARNPSNVGSWCEAGHGWLHFDSVKVPPAYAVGATRKLKKAA